MKTQAQQYRVRAAFVILAVLITASPRAARAQKLMILHTNDTHSHFEEAEDLSLAQDNPHAPGPAKGGMAQLKAKIDELKREAAAKGWDTLVVDAGDFTEGTQYFLADQGRESWRIMNDMGYDAVALGNHDFYVGQDEMDRIIGDVKPDYPLLSANFMHSRKLRNLNQYMQPYVELRRAGVKLGIIGLVTDGAVWKWRAGDDVIQDPQRALDAYVDGLAKRNDYVIVLSHLGLGADHKLVSMSGSVDLVVGSHSHDFVCNPMRKGEAVDWAHCKPDTEEDLFGAKVPIVQAGQHGEVVGKLVVDVQKGKPLKVVSYELVPVLKDGPQDPVVARDVQGTKDILNAQYGDHWLHEQIGYSEIPMVVPRNKPTPWGLFVNDALRKAAGADLAVDDVGGAIYGDNLPAGPITREKLFRFYARVFNNESERKGWTIWTVEARGWTMRAAIGFIMDAGIEFKAAGLTYKAKHYPLIGWKVSNLRINGRPIGLLDKIRLALPEGIGMALRDSATFSPARLWLHHPTDTGVPIWTALERELIQRGRVLR